MFLGLITTIDIIMYVGVCGCQHAPVNIINAKRSAKRLHLDVYKRYNGVSIQCMVLTTSNNVLNKVLYDPVHNNIYYNYYYKYDIGILRKSLKLRTMHWCMRHNH